MPEPQLRYKFLLDGMRSAHGDQRWTVGKWETVKGDIVLCHNGFHCSASPVDALRAIRGGIVAQVEVRGEHQVDTDKEVWRSMRVVQAWRWTGRDSVELACVAAETVLPLFERRFPNDARPRQAIAAARSAVPAAGELDSSRAAAAARAAWAAAAAAAAAAAWAAWAAAAEAEAEAAAAAAAWAAEAAAWAAAWAAAEAEAAAARAAAAAAPGDLPDLDAIRRWMVERIVHLEPAA